MVRDTILNPKDKIYLPDREASILRKTQQLSRYDDDDFPDVEKENEQIMKTRMQQMTLQKATGGNDDGGDGGDRGGGDRTIARERATQPGPHSSDHFDSPQFPDNQYSPYTRFGARARSLSRGYRLSEPPPDTKLDAPASSSGHQPDGKPPPPPTAPKLQATAAAKPAVQIFDMDVEDELERRREQMEV